MTGAKVRCKASSAATRSTGSGRSARTSSRPNSRPTTSDGSIGRRRHRRRADRVSRDRAGTIGSAITHLAQHRNEWNSAAIVQAQFEPSVHVTWPNFWETELSGHQQARTGPASDAWRTARWRGPQLAGRPRSEQRSRRHTRECELEYGATRTAAAVRTRSRLHDAAGAAVAAIDRAGERAGNKHTAVRHRSGGRRPRNVWQPVRVRAHRPFDVFDAGAAELYVQTRSDARLLRRAVRGERPVQSTSVSSSRARSRHFGYTAPTGPPRHAPDGARRVTDGATGFTLRNRDFNVQSFRSNLVLRWEWRRGSTLYLVWQQDPESELITPIGVSAGDMFSSLGRAWRQFLRDQDVVLVLPELMNENAELNLRTCIENLQLRTCCSAFRVPSAGLVFCVGVPEACLRTSTCWCLYGGSARAPNSFELC